MRALKDQDVQRIIQLFENELAMLPRVSRTDRMKLRKKITNTLMPLLQDSTVTEQRIMQRIDAKLSDVLALFFDPNLFRSKLAGLLADRTA
jgi:hypothetical protein